ncbi:Glutathione S-transferase family protein [Quillaja saponaria]|uniref:Glutathione S-transferase family protein n=1 Tax=Quillaja saponaria TaxID=32244 RepID=A0AAD7VEH5_QUISA|nr:Glutathione S-transferase family protein [Quillaja saponaria]
MPSCTSFLISHHIFLIPPSNNTHCNCHFPTITKAPKPTIRHGRSKMSLNQTPRPEPSNSNLSILNSLTKLLWGQSLPPGLLISTVRTAWNSTWRLMMSQLAPSDPSSGGYSRPPSKFRITQFPLQNPTALHLYIGLPCPWAHRTVIVRALKGLEDAVPLSVASPGLDGSWEFKRVFNGDRDILIPSLDRANGCKTLKQVYKLRRGGHDGRSTVPMLWDVDRKEVVCNESYDIIEFFNTGLNGLARNPGLDLSPKELKGKVEEWNQIIYPSVNNGVYRCGFAQSQEAYDTAVNELFNTLDMVDDHLGNSRYLCGDTLTLADICMFTTLIRFDLVYNVLFKCTKKKLVEYANLHAYMCDIYQIPKVAATCNFTAIMDGYYRILFPLNPGSIQPVMPSGSGHEVLSRPHGRESLSSADETTGFMLNRAGSLQ